MSTPVFLGPLDESIQWTSAEGSGSVPYNAPVDLSEDREEKAPRSEGHLGSRQNLRGTGPRSKRRQGGGGSWGSEGSERNRKVGPGSEPPTPHPSLTFYPIGDLDPGSADTTPGWVVRSEVSVQ